LKNTKAHIQFIKFQVLESHIVFKEKGDYKVQIGFNPRGEVQKTNNLFYLKLGIQVKDEDDKFSVELDTLSTFKYSDESSLDEYINGLFVLNAPAIIFPYLRAFITNITSQSGMSPLILPTLNLSKLGDDLKENIEIID